MKHITLAVQCNFERKACNFEASNTHCRTSGFCENPFESYLEPETKPQYDEVAGNQYDEVADNTFDDTYDEVADTVIEPINHNKNLPKSYTNQSMQPGDMSFGYVNVSYRKIFKLRISKRVIVWIPIWKLV